MERFDWSDILAVGAVTYSTGKGPWSIHNAYHATHMYKDETENLVSIHLLFGRLACLSISLFTRVKLESRVLQRPLFCDVFFVALL